MGILMPNHVTFKVKYITFTKDSVCVCVCVCIYIYIYDSHI